jgi:preprotein translocase subunit Sss1
MARIAALPTRRELTRFAVWVALGRCVLGLIGLRMWWRYVSACGG